MQEKKALWPGRFQPPTIAHLDTADAILNAGWPHVTVAVVYNVPRPAWVDPGWNQYLAISDVTAFGPGKIIFTPEEVMAMWETTILRANLQKFVSVVSMMRTQYNPTLHTDFPPDEYDYIVPTLVDSTDELDIMRRELYERMFRRHIATVVPTLTLHISEIRQLIRDDMGGWRDALPPGGYEVFMRLNGPQRVEEADKLAEEARMKKPDA